MYCAISMAFTYQLQIHFLEVIPPTDFSRQLTNYEPSFLITINDFSAPTSILESLATKPKLFKELIQQRKHSQHIFL